MTHLQHCVIVLPHTATHCNNTLQQHTARKHCNTQWTSFICAIWFTFTCVSWLIVNITTLQDHTATHTATYCNKTHCNTLQQHTTSDSATDCNKTLVTPTVPWLIVISATTQKCGCRYSFVVWTTWHCNTRCNVHWNTCSVPVCVRHRNSVLNCCSLQVWVAWRIHCVLSLTHV